MKVVILAGGFGTRLQEETATKPKPMVEIGGKPMLWHIMNLYAAHGFNEFVVALGYKGEIIRDYFLNYRETTSDLTVKLGSGHVTVHDGPREDWTVHLIDTGAATMTGGRVKRVARWLQDETFMLTYGDGLSSVDIGALVKYHRSHGKLATVTAVRPPARFGAMRLQEDRVDHFVEKAQANEGWVNGGFFVLEPAVLDYIKGDEIDWEREPLETLARTDQLRAWQHEGFWQCMDTLRDVRYLERLWESGAPPWRTRQ